MSFANKSMEMERNYRQTREKRKNTYIIHSTLHSNHQSTSYQKSVAINMPSLLGFHQPPAWGRLCANKCPRGASLWPSCFPVRQAPSEMPVRLRQICLQRVTMSAKIRGFPGWFTKHGTEQTKIYAVQIRRPESACSSNNLMQNPNRSQNPKSKIRNPKSKIQNPKSKIQNPKSKIQNPKSKIQNPRSKIQNPKSKIQTAAFGAATKRTDITTIQNPKSKIQNPKSKIQNPKSKNPKSKIQNPKSKIQDPKSKIQNPKSKIQNPKSKIQNPRSKIQTPKSKIQNPNGPFGFWILDFGFGWPGWGGYVANALVWMGWPPKFGVVGRDSSLQAKGRRLDSTRARLKLGPDFQRVALLETEPRFPALRRGNWGPISRKIVESCGVPSNFSMRDTFLLGREIFRANIIGKVD